MSRYQIHVCDGPSCGITHGSEGLVEHLRTTIEQTPTLRGRVEVGCYTCFGRCDDGPNLFVQRLAEGELGGAEPEPDVLESQRGFYPGMDPSRARRVLHEHCGQDRVVDEWVDDY